MSEPEDLSQFSMLELFRMEAEGQTQILTDGLLSLERGSSGSTIEPMMRAAHSIKGAAAIVGLDLIVQLAHGMEDAFIAAQHGQLRLTPNRVDVLLAGVDLIVQCSNLKEANLPAWLATNEGNIRSTMNAIVGIAFLPEPVEKPAAPVQVAAPPPPVPAEAVEAPPAAPPTEEAAPPTERRAGHTQRGAAQGDRLLSLASESRINAHQMHPLIETMQRFKRSQSALLTALDDLHEAIARSGIPALQEKAALVLQRSQPLKQTTLAQITDMENYERRLLNVSNQLVDEVLAMRMRPFRDGVQHFPRMVRDLARNLGKEVHLEIRGEDTLVDRDILSRIENPLNHMLRNAVDHGLEPPAVRVANGKSPMGTIVLEARHRAGMLNIEIVDDGQGVDPQRIRRAVVERKMATPAMADTMSNGELMEFLFLPAFSLKEDITEISGRGVGLDIVQDTIRQQNGTVHVQSQPGLGFHTSITLPLTQSIVRSLVVDVRGEAYAIPIVKIERVELVPQAAIHTLENKQFFDLNGEHLGLVSSAQVLELGDMEHHELLPVIVIGTGARRYGLVVDAIRGEQSLAVQSIDPIFGKLRDISSAALLNDGEPVLILDVPDLLLSIEKLLAEGGLHQLARADSAARRRMKRILVVDDSLTVREMERKLLTGRGFEVDIAVDGIDGWNVVRSGDYDLVITDVDMPRMDGIELVNLIKKDIHLHTLPVMIVSYKDRPEDRARGLAAGADYYLTKGSFHDETLLDAVHDLVGDASR
ncbi:hybrid sensor histidine kinase/response regulator [Pseudoduganella buxea]|uniref:Chemotaxis protein CheA n=1 Tax=Pseudoduganella buxea TaxID=1949069 RepID=A0A6I3T4N0_9BURK|nr:hybrid sensor histidine kinase/response regulator [Pseudoduganella buxea]MTV55895.1 response regulator [Pseudoduganella buxea]GGC20562.1 hybrid sensor histidine kinase/response regulator [Pseudoduganella buxea]